MRVRSPDVLAECFRLSEVSQAEVAEAAGCSRQFVWALTSGERLTCKDEIARVIIAKLEAAGVTDAASLFLSDASGLTGCDDRSEAGAAA